MSSMTPTRPVIVLSACLSLGLLLGGCPTDHPRATLADTIEFDETSSANGFQRRTVSSGGAAPHLPFMLMVDIESDQPLIPDDVQVFVTFRCAFGNTNTFPVELSETGISGQALQGSFERAANNGTTECVGPSGQRELTTWSVQFVRPSGTTQQVSFDYEFSWAEGSTGN